MVFRVLARRPGVGNAEGKADGLFAEWRRVGGVTGREFFADESDLLLTLAFENLVLMRQAVSTGSCFRSHSAWPLLTQRRML